MHKIMIVDDEVVIATQLEESLTALGYDVVGTADSGKKAIEMAKELRPDLVLMDIVMPGELDGIDAARILKQECRIPILFITAYTGYDLFDRARDLEPAAYIIKPFQESQIRAAVEIALRNAALEKELAASEEKYRELVENINDVLYSIDVNGSITYVSPQAERVFGYRPSELVGTDFLQLIHEDDQEEILGRFQQVLQGKTFPSEYRLQAKDGAYRWVRTSSRPVLRGAEVVGLNGVLTDITESKNSRERLHQSKQLLEKTLASLFDAVFILEAGRREIVDCNPAAEQIFGYSRENLLGRSPDFLHVDSSHLNRFKAQLETSVKEKGYLSLSGFKMKRKDGTIFPTEHSVMPIYDEHNRAPIAWVSVVRDITDRHQAMEEARFRNLVLDQIQDRIAVTDLQGNITYVNDAESRMLKMERERIIGKHVSLFGEDPNEGATQEDILRNTLEHGAWRGEVVNLDAQGGRVILEARTQIVRDSRGEPVALCGISTDITERKKAEKALRESEQFRGRIIQSLVSGLYVYSLEKLHNDFISDQYTVLTGWTLHEINEMGRRFVELFHPEDRPRVEEHFRRVQEAEDGEVLEIEYRFRTKNGRWIWCISRDTVFERNEKGDVTRFIGSFFDITERKQAEEALAESEFRFRSFVENANDIVYSLTPEGIFTYISPNWADALGEPPEEAVGKSFEPYVHPEDVHMCRAFLERVLSTGEKQSSVEYRVRHRDGSWRWHLSNGSPMWDKEGKVTGYVGIARDITERRKDEEHRKRLEAQLRQSQKMEAIGTLAGGIAHDFNNILGIIVGNAELAMFDIPAWSAAQESLKEIRAASLRARDLVTQILLFARQKEHTLSNIRAEPIARESLKMLRATIPTTVEIRKEIQEDLPTVLADAAQIQQVIMNLCTNAGQVMEAEGGTLTFKMNPVELGAPTDTLAGRIPEGRYVRIQVRDTGPGIPPEKLERIFEPFFTTKGVGEGTGLGLAVVHGIVQDRQGGILVESEEGKGTAFTVYLPASEETPAADESKEDEAELPKGTERILLVDDEPMILELGRRMLERQGYSVVTRASGTDALECFRQDPTRFDLVVTDMSMPGLRGDKLAEEILKTRSDIPVILSTGFSKQISEEKAKDLGIRAFVMKPLTAHELANTLRQVLDGT